MKNANPSLNPANNGTLAGALETAFNKVMQGVSDMLPAKVIKFDRTANRVQVQPLIAIVTTDESTVSRAQLASLPVLQLGGGGFVLNFNLIPGDLGWIKANDRDISLFLNSYKESKPNSNRLHSFSDAVFIPDVMTGYTIAGEDADNAVLQSLDGTVKISLGIGKIKVSAPIVEIDGATNVAINSPAVFMTVSTGIAIDTPLLFVDGDIAASGTITPGVLDDPNHSS
jgi:hypothetical protein